jgi:cytochrome c oxidase cbb3-type subunit 2
MLWGSKRTGPDIARLGGKYSDAWHVAHLINPRDVVPGSVMPKYGWLMRNELRTDDLSEHLAAQKTVGVPYTEAMIGEAVKDAYAQATPDSPGAAGVSERYGEATKIRAFDGDAARVTEMDALVAYLQILGRLTEIAYEQPKPAGD